MSDESAFNDLLKKLACPGAFGVFQPDDTFAVRQRRQDGAPVTVAVTQSLARIALAKGWIAERREGVWGLTASGRARFRNVPGRANTGQTAIRDQTASPQAKPSVNVSESPLAWLSRRNNSRGEPLLSVAEVEAGERLRADFTLGHMMPQTTTNWSLTASCRGAKGDPSYALEYSERVSSAQERLRRALAAVGPELSGVLIDVCCHLKSIETTERAAGWPQRSAKLVLQLALSALARHYGLLKSGAMREATSRIRQWGAEDYRPVPHA